MLFGGKRKANSEKERGAAYFGGAKRSSEHLLNMLNNAKTPPLKVPSKIWGLKNLEREGEEVSRK